MATKRRAGLPRPTRLTLLSSLALIPFLALLAPRQPGATAAALASFTVAPLARHAVGLQTPHFVSYDRYSLLLDGHRLVLFGGEYQFWRTPAPDRWPVVLAEMRAAGLNAVSVGISWQYHSPAPGMYDFSGVRDLGRFLDDAAAAGLYVIARPGPVDNTESSASNLPGWLLARTGNLRANSGHAYCGAGAYSPAYASAYTDWYRHVLPIIAARQVTTGGGSVIAVQIENEYAPRCGDARYMSDLHDLARQEGIDVPLIANNNSCCVAAGAWHNTGDDGQPIADIPAEDDYPCANLCAPAWTGHIFSALDTLEARVRAAGVSDAPIAIAELQGGYFTGWGQQSYTRMGGALGPDFSEVLDGSALGQGATLISVYMVAGGTSWGYLAGPDTATSYDYNAAIHEWGAPGATYGALKRTGMFVAAFADALGATRRSSLVAATSPGLLYAARETVDGPQRGAQFIVLRNTDPRRWAATQLRLPVGGYEETIPWARGASIQQPPHSLSMLLANYNLGPFHLSYSTSRPLTQARVNGDQVAVFYGTPGTGGETALYFPSRPALLRVDKGISAYYDARSEELYLDYAHQETPRYVVISYGRRRLVLILTGPQGAAHTWRLATQDGPDLVMGPAMATSASVHRDALYLHVELQGHTPIAVWAPGGARHVMVEGLATAGSKPRVVTPQRRVGVYLRRQSALHYDGTLHSLATTLDLGTPGLSLPALTTWRFARESPETAPGFDDSRWVRATEKATSNPNVPRADSLLADDYGFHYGFVWYRGHFSGRGGERYLYIFARNSYSVWLNGVYLGSSSLHNDLKNTDDQLALYNPRPSNANYADGLLFHIPRGLVRPGAGNVIAILTESLGHNIGFENGQLTRSPMGLLSVQIRGSRRAPSIAWRLQGAAAATAAQLTSDNGMLAPLNASGLYGERNGWYRPGYRDAAWQRVHVPDNWAARGLRWQGVGWYRTTFSLNLPTGMDVPLGLYIPRAQDKVVIWLNGLLIGRYWQQAGPQHTFYLPAGLLHVQGRNTLALAVWNRGDAGGLTGGVYLRPYSATAQVTLRAVR